MNTYSTIEAFPGFNGSFPDMVIRTTVAVSSSILVSSSG